MRYEKGCGRKITVSRKGRRGGGVMIRERVGDENL